MLSHRKKQHAVALLLKLGFVTPELSLAEPEAAKPRMCRRCKWDSINTRKKLDLWFNRCGLLGAVN